MTQLIDNIYFQKLSRQDPAEVCRRALCGYDAAARFYAVTAWGDDYAVYPHECRIDRLTRKDPAPHDYFYLFVIYYLLNSREIEISGEWISEKDIPGGPTFFRGPHLIPTRLVSQTYRNDIESFRNKCERLHGKPVKMADAAYRFEITARIPVSVLYWIGDDDFPPEAKILFDRTITEHLPADILFALAVAICTRIGRSTA
ncbi:MAG: DUF3786 domain-containing protein [Thermodesulfobacteriota bacterium]